MDAAFKYYEVKLALYSSYAGEHLAFDSFEESTTTGRNVGYFVGQTELVHASNRVAATNEGECAVLGCLYHSISNGTAATGEVVEFKHAGRSVPEDSLGAFDCLCKEFAGLGTGIETFPAFGNVHHGANLSVGVVVESVGCDAVGTKNEVYTFLFSLLHDVQSEVELVGFADRSTNVATLCLCEGVGHTTAQNQVVNLVHQVFDNTDFGRYL